MSKAIEQPIGTTLYKGDCLVEMDKIADKSVDLIITDLPFGTTKNR